MADFLVPIGAEDANADCIVLLQQRIEQITRLWSELYDLGESRVPGETERRDNLRARFDECVKACTEELEMRRRPVHPEELAELRARNSTFYSPGDAVADPVVHCKLNPAREVARTELEQWLTGKIHSIRFALWRTPDRERDRRAAQRSLLIDAMLNVESNWAALTNSVFRTSLNGLVNANGRANITWCEATNAVSVALGRGPLPTFDARLAAVAANGALSNAEKVVKAALLMRGCFEWKTKEDVGSNPGGDNDFRRWLNHGAAEPDQHSTMNCWEAVYFAAYKAGVMPLATLQTLYNKPTSQGDATLVGYAGAVDFDPAAVHAAAGEVLFSDVEGEASKHVVLAVGQGMVMSCWNTQTGGSFDLATMEVLTDAPPTQPLIAVKRASPF